MNWIKKVVCCSFLIGCVPMIAMDEQAMCGSCESKRAEQAELVKQLPRLIQEHANAMVADNGHKNFWINGLSYSYHPQKPANESLAVVFNPTFQGPFKALRSACFDAVYYAKEGQGIDFIRGFLAAQKGKNLKEYQLRVSQIASYWCAIHANKKEPQEGRAFVWPKPKL